MHMSDKEREIKEKKTLPKFMLDAEISDFDSVVGEKEHPFDGWYSGLEKSVFSNTTIEELLKVAFTEGMKHMQSITPKCAIDEGTGDKVVMDAGLFQ